MVIFFYVQVQTTSGDESEYVLAMQHPPPVRNLSWSTVGTRLVLNVACPLIFECIVGEKYVWVVKSLFEEAARSVVHCTHIIVFS